MVSFVGVSRITLSVNYSFLKVSSKQHIKRACVYGLPEVIHSCVYGVLKVINVLLIKVIVIISELFQLAHTVTLVLSMKVSSK